MMRGISATTEKFLLDLERLQKRSAKAQQQLSSGLKITKVSDAPDEVSRLLIARANLASVVQTQQNLGRVKLEVDTAEKALQNAVSLLERARTLTAQGANDLQGPATRRQIASELQGILERLVAVAATAVEDRYLFSGDSDQTPPYELDLSTNTGVGPYQGSAPNRMIADTSGLLFSIAQSADVIFDAPDPENKVFAAVQGARRALLAVDQPTDPPDPTIPTVAQALRQLETANRYLNQQLASYGLIQNRVREALDAATRLEISQRAQIAEIEEADLAQVAVELTQTRTVLEAALQARAANPRRSLFDVLR
ncbi:MAG: flagellin [Bryobacteraceae bacterium]|nr:flagellin [Bryobacteraceae bacterium]MDW8380238.1 flagellin [Bryobacterales bacterium]